MKRYLVLMMISPSLTFAEDVKKVQMAYAPVNQKTKYKNDDLVWSNVNAKYFASIQKKFAESEGQEEVPLFRASKYFVVKEGNKIHAYVIYNESSKYTVWIAKSKIKKKGYLNVEMRVLGFHKFSAKQFDDLFSKKLRQFIPPKIKK